MFAATFAQIKSNSVKTTNKPKQNVSTIKTMNSKIDIYRKVDIISNAYFCYTCLNVFI